MALILHDATEARQKTFEAIESERIQALTLLAASVAHEIGNPLNALHIHLQLMERELKKLNKLANGCRTAARDAPATGARPRTDVAQAEVLEIAEQAGALSGRGQRGDQAAGLYRHAISAGDPARPSRK